jgi:hypothetical protein
MSDVAIVSDSAKTSSKTGWLKILFVNLPYLALYAITVWLVAVTDRDSAAASAYWQWFVPVVALVATFGGWHHAGVGGRAKVLYLMRQVMHWAALLIVTNLLFLPPMQAFLNAQSHGFIVAYLLGLAAILSGIYLDWKMAVFGAFIVGSAVGVGYLDDNAMLLTVIAVAVAGVAVSLLVQRHAKA